LSQFLSAIQTVAVPKTPIVEYAPKLKETVDELTTAIALRFPYISGTVEL
jgi:hypothetical protein